MHNVLRPDRGIDCQTDKCQQNDAVDHRPRGRIGRNIAHHEDISCDADERKDRAEWHAEGPRCFRQSCPENEHIQVRDRVGRHPEEAPDQNEVRELGCIRKTRRIDEDHHAADEKNAEAGRALLIPVHEDLRQKTDLRHARADIGERADHGIDRADDREDRDKRHPDAPCISEEMDAVVDVRRRARGELAPIRVIVHAEHNEDLHPADNKERENHAEWDRLLRVSYIFRDRNHELASKKQEKCKADHRENSLRI